MTFEVSSELQAVVRRWGDALFRRDFVTAAAMFHRGEHGRYVGSDEHEWWRGVEFVDAYPQHQDELPEFSVDVEEVEAFESGSVGWGAIKTRAVFGQEEPRSLRFTFVFVLEEGFWRIVQTHVSVAVPNTQAVGVEMTRSLEDLIASFDNTAEGDIRSSIQHGTVTLVFTDIEGSTELAQSMGDDSWSETIEWHNETIKGIVEANHGTLVKTLGDGTMAAFESVREAARATFQIQSAFTDSGDDQELKVRIGLHVGDVVLSGDDYLGNTVNKAARITAAGRGGDITVSTAVKAMLSDDPEFDFGETHSIQLKGITGTHRIASLQPGPKARI